jgi:CubicO group peptidase (beta-lactamase class C family)
MYFNNGLEQSSQTEKKKRVVWLLRIIMPIVAIICTVVFVPWNGVLTWLAPIPETVQEQVDDAIDHGLDGIIVYVDQSGKEPALYAAGAKNRQNQEPADPEALFKIASISKLYIAAATAKLVHSERLSLNDTLADHLPELEGRIENADQITLRMLLQHRSGIPNFVDQKEFDWSKSHTDISEHLQLVLDKPANFEPDESYQYSNTNYLLIGRILDNVLGYSHHQYIREQLLDPLGLTHTYGLLSQVNYDEVVSGYHHPYEGDTKELDWVTPGGSMIATAQDVGIFLRALIDGSLLNSEEQTIYSSVYGYEHTGWLLGYYSIARYHKDIDAVVVQFVNTTGENTLMVSNIVYNRIVKILSRQ